MPSPFIFFLEDSKLAIEHNVITDPNRHEPKGIIAAAAGTVYVATGGGTDGGSWTEALPAGIASAGANEVYVADGAGSGIWERPEGHIGAYVAFDKTTPAFSVALTTSDQILDPTFSITDAHLFSGETSPNARLVYDGVATRHAVLSLSLSSQQASGSGKDIEISFLKNGTELLGTRSIRTASTASWGSMTILGSTQLSTSDYIEVQAKASASTTLLVAAMSFTISASLE